jgi:hypothetical protein
MDERKSILENYWFYFWINFLLGVLFIIFRFDIIHVGNLRSWLYAILTILLIIDQVLWYLYMFSEKYSYFGNLIGLLTGIFVMYGIRILFHL